MERAKSILDKSYFRAKEKEKVNKLRLVTLATPIGRLSLDSHPIDSQF